MKTIEEIKIENDIEEWNEFVAQRFRKTKVAWQIIID